MVVVETKEETKEFTAKKIKNEFSEKMSEQFPELREMTDKDKYCIPSVRFAPGTGDTLLLVHGQSIADFYDVKYTEKFYVSGTSTDGFVHVEPNVIGHIDCTIFMAVPQLREAVHTHNFFDDDAHQFMKPLESNLVVDYVTEYDTSCMRVTFVNARFTKVDTNINLDNIVFVNRYHFEADDIKTEVFHKINDEWVVEASSETTIKAGVELG